MGPDPQEACLHRGEERILVGLAAYGPHGAGCSRVRGGALHTDSPQPRLSALDPRGAAPPASEYTQANKTVKRHYLPGASLEPPAS